MHTSCVDPSGHEILHTISLSNISGCREHNCESLFTHTKEKLKESGEAIASVSKAMPHHKGDMAAHNVDVPAALEGLTSDVTTL